MLLAQTMHLAFLLGADQIKASSTLGGGYRLCRLHILGGLHRFCERAAGGSLGFCLVHALLAKRDVALLLGRFNGQPLRDLGLADLLFTPDITGTNGFLHLDLRGIGRDFGFRLACGDFSKLGCAKRFQRLHLFDLRFLLLQINLQRPLRRFHGRPPHRYFRIGVDGGTFLLRIRDHFGELAHADGVECVVLVECCKGRLVESGQRYGFKLETVSAYLLGQRRFDFFHKRTPALMEFVHGLLRGDRAQGIDQLALDQIPQFVGLECAPPKRLRRPRDRFLGRFHRHIKLDTDIDTQPVLGNQGLFAMTVYLESHGLHVDAADLVEIGQHDHPAIKDDLAPSEAGAHQRDLA